MSAAFKIFLLVGTVLYGLPGLVWWLNRRHARREGQSFRHAQGTAVGHDPTA